METKITLNTVLPILEGEDKNNAAYFFLDPNQNLETFFNYKGTLIELGKMNLKIAMGKATPDEIGEEIRATLVGGLQKGYWLVFDIGGSFNMNIKEFFKNFKWFNNGLFEMDKIKDKKFLKESGILKENEDKDFADNKGWYQVNKDSRIFFLGTFDLENVEKFKTNNADVKFNYLQVD